MIYSVIRIILALAGAAVSMLTVTTKQMKIAAIFVVIFVFLQSVISISFHIPFCP